MFPILSGTVEATTLTIEQLASHEHRPGNLSTFITEGGSGEAQIDANPNFKAYSKQEYTNEVGGSLVHKHSFTGPTSQNSALPMYYALTYIMRII